ncbi:hypothetical protein [Entomospira culicis]|uniref:Uncharacterized protein n=1 Tax=Entomospira culicis TaxID=2719989 RepID=A0A968GFF7_9SPIO|nr:hypothetical protein [Entomospira culicis]NIZ18813.1 hypothetical protein [Entomospira culicis]NIZ69028.1 hypothetical protein [Entomospira culicis]WDI37618.1 hypothetical protein PVA46_02205 [Entomospira culicis]WDI39246.1 hypothetical protein PVA47_02210 [Entomospira culicis]
MRNIAIVIFLLVAGAMFTVSALAVGKFDSYHARVLFFFNEAKQRKEGSILAQKGQSQVEDAIRFYLLALLSRPANGNMRPIFDGLAHVRAVHLLPHQSVVVVTWPEIVHFRGDLTLDMELVEYGLNFNFPELAPFSLVIDKGIA